MALTDVVFTNHSAVANRGDVGVLVDINYKASVNKLSLVVPTVDQVSSGVSYGQQGTSLTGTLVGGGGGGEHSYTFQS